MEAPRSRLGIILIRQGVISSEELEAGMLYQVRTEAMGAGNGAGRAFRLGEALIALGICSEDQVARGLAEQLAIPFVDLSTDQPTDEAMNAVPLELAAEYGVLPVRMEGDCLVVAAADPGDLGLQEALRRITGAPVISVAGASPQQIRDLISALQRGVGAEALEPAGGEDVDEIGGGAGLDQVAAEPAAFSAVEILNAVLAEASRRGASDVFFGPRPEGTAVQMRLEGSPQTVLQLSQDLHEPLMMHILLTCGLDPTAAGRRQEGRCRVHVDGKPVRLHAATLPGSDGAADGAVIRLAPAQA